MTKFEIPQKTFEIAGVTLGGQPGEWPTVMCGSIFYDRHKIVRDASTGDFDKEAAKALLANEKELAECFGLQRMPDVIGNTFEALVKYTDFVLEQVDGPILVDSASIDILLKTFRHYKNSDVISRMVFSPLDLHTTEEHFKEIADIGVKNALVMAFSPDAVLPSQKIGILSGSENGKTVASESLLAKASQAGIENILVDVGVIDLQGTAWSSLSIEKEKSILGLPAGCAPANALFSWLRDHKDTMHSKPQTTAAGGAVYASTIYSGADFVLYGPMHCADWAFAACASADALVSYGNRLSGVRAKTRSHALYKLK